MLNRPHAASSASLHRSQSFDIRRRGLNNAWNSIDRGSISSSRKNSAKTSNVKTAVNTNDDASSIIDNAESDSDWNSDDNEKASYITQNGRGIKNENLNNNNNNDANNNKKTNLIWPLGKKAPALIIFSPEAVLRVTNECRKIGEQFRLTYKFQGGEKKIVKAILDGHGFKEVHPHSAEFNILWTGNNLKTYVFRTLKEYQKVNHFPRSCELTRKDRLYKNVQKMQQEKGAKAFQIVPVTFIMPYEIDDFYSTFYKEKGLWIVKPVASSRGRGIYLISHPDQVPLDDNLVVSKYVTNPLLIEGYKFDLRMYVAVTSFDPLVIYLYEEGLTRFATCKYDKSLRNLRNTWMHLTNYSVNKKNKKYVRCDDPDVEDYGNKWTMSAMLRYLAREGKDTFGMMMQIEELIIKTILSVESPMASAARMFIPNRGNCFEVYGFDILIDEDLKPWVLEVNLSPSLDCDAVLDLRVKSHMVSDLFTITGVYCQDPSVYSNRSRFAQRADTVYSRQSTRSRPHSANLLTSTLGNHDTNTQLRNQFDQRPSTSKSRASSLARTKSEYSAFEGLSQNEVSIFKGISEEHNRRGGWVRLFPTSDTWEFFSQYLEVRTTSYNLMLHQKLFPKRWLNGSSKRTSISRAKVLQSSYVIYKQTNNQNLLNTDTGACLDDAIKRYKLYERKLGENLNNGAFEMALKRFSNSNENNSNNNYMVNSRAADSDNDDHISVTSNKPPISNPSTSSVSSVKVSTNGNNNNTNNNTNGSGNGISNTNNQVKKDYIINGSKRSPFNVNNLHDNNDNQQQDYDLDTILKNLDDGYYMSRTQVRFAFTLYLTKIQLRLVIESEVKDESNVQQMELVLRFMKKASVNLTQQFKVYVPSKRLPINEQKRMLAKELQDFLYLYKKDTEQLKLDVYNELETIKAKNVKNVFNEAQLTNFLNKCSEMQLEEIMSAYMKNSKDSSAFLGTSSSNSSKKNGLKQNKNQQLDESLSEKKAKKAQQSANTTIQSGDTTLNRTQLSNSNGGKSVGRVMSDNEEKQHIHGNLNDEDSSICSSNSSLVSNNQKLNVNGSKKRSKERNEHKNNLMKINQASQSIKQAYESNLKQAKLIQIEKNGSIVKEKLTDFKHDDGQYSRRSLTSDNIKALNENAAIMTLHLQNSDTSNKHQSPTRRRLKSATVSRVMSNHTVNEKQQSSDNTSLGVLKRPVSATVYVHKHNHNGRTESTKNSKNQHNEFEIDTYDDSEHELEDDEETDNKNWSERLKNLAQKKQGRQYSASVAKSILKSSISDLNKENSENEIDNEDELLKSQTILIKKQKEILEHSKKVLQLSKTNSLFSQNNVKPKQQTKLLSTLERYSPIDINNQQLTSKPPPAPITTTTLLSTSNGSNKWN